jgi:hypothetical protein
MPRQQFLQPFLSELLIPWCTYQVDSRLGGSDVSIENLLGSAYGDALAGNNAANTLIGGNKSGVAARTLFSAARTKTVSSAATTTTA